MALIGDILAKLGDSLTADERNTLRHWGNMAQLDSAYIAGLQSGGSDVIGGRAEFNNSVTSGKNVMSEVGLIFNVYNLSVANDTTTTLTPSTQYINGFSVSGTSITPSLSGIYRLQIFARYASDNTTGRRYVGVSGFDVGTHFADVAPSGNNTTMLVNFDQRISKDAAFSVQTYQNSGLAKSLNVFFKLSLISFSTITFST